MRQPNLNSLRMFDSAASHLNFRLAAEELNLTQGAVAQQVRKLESDLETQLFERLPRGLALTEKGKIYHKDIRQAFAIIEEANFKLTPNNSSIALSVTPSFASKWLVPRLATFANLQPEIDIQTLASEGIANFKTDGVDLAIRQGQPPFGKQFKFQLLAPLNLVAVCSPDYAKQFSSIEQLADFVDLKLINDGHQLWNSLFEEAGIKVSHRISQFNQTALAMDAASNDQGIALAPDLLLGNEISQRKLVPVWRDADNNHGGYYFVYPNTKESNPAREAFIRWAISEVNTNCDNLL